MARIVDYSALPSGGYMAIDDTGQSIPTAYLPPAVKMGIDQQKQSGMAPPPSQLRADIAEAAMAPQNDNRLASNGQVIELPDQSITGTAPNAFDQGIRSAGKWIGDKWQGIKDAGAEIRAREAARGNFSGIHNTDVAAAGAAGVAPPDPNLVPSNFGGGGEARGGGGESGGASVVPPDQRVQIGGQRNGMPLAFAGGGGGGVQVIRGGERKAGEVIGSTSYDPDAAANLKRGYQNQYEGTQKAGAAQQQADQGEAGVMGQIPEGLRNLEAQRQEHEAIRQQSIAGDMDKLNQLRQQARQDVDPGRIYTHQTNADKLWGALLVGLGELGAGMSGRPNVALGIMNKAMDNDIDSQKANIANKRDQFHDQQSLYKDNLHRFQDERQAEVATKATYLEHAQAQLASLRAQAKAPEDEAKIDLLSAEIQKESAKNDLEFSKITHQVHTTVVPDRVVGGSRGPSASPLDHEKYVPQFGGIAPTKDEAVLARAKGSSLNTMTQLASENLRLRNNPQAFIRGTDAYRQLNSNQAQLVLEVKRKENADLGVIAGPDMGLMTDAIGDATSATPGQSAAIQNFVSNSKRMNENIRKNLGLVPVQTAPYRDADTGEIKIGQRITGNVITPGNVNGEVDEPIQTQKSHGGGKRKKGDD